jgi:O-antigen ligase
MIWYISIHTLFGFLVAFFTESAFYWQIATLIIGFLEILTSANKRNEAALWAAYLAGMELFIRMTGETIFWEAGKYGVILFLTLGLVVNSQSTRIAFWLYLLFLIPSLFIANYDDLTEARKMISFNLSGPLCLAATGIYFYKSVYTQKELVLLIRVMILPIFSIVAYLFLRTPDFSSISFETESNIDASGGYGPNQVSLVLGAAVFCFLVFRFYGVSLSGYKWLDYSCMIVLLFRGLITFSRGGVLGAVIAILVVLGMNFLNTRSAISSTRAILFSLLLLIMGWFVWDYTNTITKSALEFRYKGVNIRTGEDEEFTGGRLLIMQRDWNTFLDNPILGVGPGRSKFLLEEGLNVPMAAHTEWSRMLAEHGLFGFVSLCILLLVPLFHAFTMPIQIRALLIGFLILSFFSMFHAAMRLAIISFLYGLALIIPVREKNSIPRK